jgi:serine/threonine protein kinase
VSDSGAGGISLGIPGIDSIQEIGRSATHTTYRVRDVASGHTVVIKLLNAGRNWPGLEERFEREQAAMAALQHPNIVQVFGHGWTETGMPYIVTGEAPGGSIGDRLRGPTPMTGPDILALGVRLAGALESAHRAGVVHGDLRPDDMMLSPQGEPLIADFGVVTVVRPNATDVTDPAELAHVAPELLEGLPATPSSDLYSLASALYTLFAGLPAYVRPGEQSVIPVIKRIASDPLPDLAAKNVPAPVVDAISRGMAKTPGERQQTAQDFGRSLQQAQVALGLPMTEMVLLGSPTATRATAVTTVTPAAVPTAATSAQAPPPFTPPPVAAGSSSPNRTPLIVGAIVAVVVLIAAIAFFATRGGDDKKVASSTSSSSSTRSSSSRSSSSSTSDSFSSDSFSTDVGGGTVLRTNTGGQLEVTAPTEWSDVDPAPTSDGAPSLRVATDLTENVAGTYLEPGIEIVAFDPATIDPSNLDAALDLVINVDRTGGTLGTVCTRGERTDFTPDGANLATARLERLSSCNGGGDVIIAAATDVDQTFTLLLEVHVGNPPDDAGVDAVMTSFNVVSFP